MLFRDARDYQILFLSSFLLLGFVTRGWSLSPNSVIVAIASCILVQWALEMGRFFLKPSHPKPVSPETLPVEAIKAPTIPFSIRSPLITALSLSLLLRTDHEITMLLAAGVAIASKFFIRINDKHCFNPANIGIIAALVVTHDAWVSPGQWGEEFWYVLLFIGAGGLVLKRVGRWDTTIAFLSTYASLFALRNLWLGWTWDVLLHQLMSGSLLLFALFMITDPRSIPNARTGRVVWSVAIAIVAFILQTIFFIPAAIFWALFFIAPTTVFIDRWWQGDRFQWTLPMSFRPTSTLLSIGVVALTWFAVIPDAQAFCGFYVAKADAELYNQASQVIIAKDGDRTVLTMANDYQGDLKDFAMVVPVPVLLEEEQVHVGEPEIIERLDGFSAPRLVEYFDENPCNIHLRQNFGDMVMESELLQSRAPSGNRPADSLGVTIESQFSVGEYDILILSARESNGLETWLQQNGYRLPNDAHRLLQPYIRQGMKFFVAKVNLENFADSEYQSLRPLQIAYESPRFMLPIRLGMMNAESEQDLLVYLLSPKGRIELTNYQTVDVPSDVELPVFVKEEFSDFYRDMFQTAYEKEGKDVAFLEYAWDMSSCDPCSAPTLSPDELRKAGVFWLDSPTSSPNRGWGGPRVFISRMHVRYSRDKFPEDLMFQETPHTDFFQGRYVLRHPFLEEEDCPEAQEYRRSLPQRFEKEAQTLVKLTGWDIDDIREKLPEVNLQSRSWWHRLWSR